MSSDDRPTHDKDFLHAIYDMVISIHKEWPELQGSVRLLGHIQDEHARRISTLESKNEDTGRHELGILRRKSDRINSVAFKAIVLIVSVLVGAGAMAAIRDIAQGHVIQVPVEVK